MFDYVSTKISDKEKEKLDELFYWDAQKGHLNEEGWCWAETGEVAPGEPPGYRPDLDKLLIENKVQSILSHFRDERFIHIADVAIFEGIVKSCKRRNRFDQDFIMYLFYKHEILSDYWKKIGENIRKGKDSRERCCVCRKLATSFYCDGEKPVVACCSSCVISSNTGIES